MGLGTPDGVDQGTARQTKRKFSTPTIGRSNKALYANASASESRLNMRRPGPRLSTSTFHLKRPNTPAAEYLEQTANYGSPRSVRTYASEGGDLANESGELVDANDISMDGHGDDGYDDLLNVRVCCNEHDVGSLARKKHHHHQ